LDQVTRDRITGEYLKGAVIKDKQAEGRTISKGLEKTEKPSLQLTLDTDIKKAQDYLAKMEFNIGKDKTGQFLIDGRMGCLTSSSLIIFQYKMGLKLTGEVNQETLAIMEKCVKEGKKYSDIMKNEGRELHTIDKAKFKNGYYDESKLVKVASAEKKPGVLPEKVAVAWALMVQEAAKDPKVKISRFLLTGDISGYRSYEMQKECKRIYGRNAATPGTSNHGWGLAIDFNVANKRSIKDYPNGVPAGSYEVEWLEKNAHKFGFKPILASGRPQLDNGANNYFENWHWEFDPKFKIN